MATKRKVKKLAGGFGEDDFAGVDEAVARNADSGEWARGENYGDNTTGDERVAMARAPAREASAEEVMAANKFAASPRPRPAAKPSAPSVAAAKKEVTQEVKSREKALKDDQYNPDVKQRSTARVGRAGQASGPDVLGGIKDYFRRLVTPPDRGHGTYRGFDGKVHTYKSGGSASTRADGIAKRGKTRGKVY